MSTDPQTEAPTPGSRLSKATLAWMACIGTFLSGVAAVATFVIKDLSHDPPMKPAGPASELKVTGGTAKEEHPASPPKPETTGPIQAPRVAHEPKPAPRPLIKLAAYNEKYIDTGVEPVKGKPNFSVFVRLPAPSQINTLQGAVQRSLRERGDNVVSLFREQFAKDELDTKLFDGNPTLAKRLELRKYCDRVLLGVVRFSGPPQNQSQSGLYMREAILNLHAIAADTGEVLSDIEISAKGRGLDEDASTRDALRALEGTVEEKVREWERK